jgi:hypothetical protein
LTPKAANQITPAMALKVTNHVVAWANSLTPRWRRSRLSR